MCIVDFMVVTACSVKYLAVIMMQSCRQDSKDAAVTSHSIPQVNDRAISPRELTADFSSILVVQPSTKEATITVVYTCLIMMFPLYY